MRGAVQSAEVASAISQNARQVWRSTSKIGFVQHKLRVLFDWMPVGRTGTQCTKICDVSRQGASKRVDYEIKLSLFCILH